jgi:chaperone BCS1
MQQHEGDPGSEKGTGFEVIPEYGTYYLIYKRHLMLVEHRKEVQTKSSQSRPLRTLRLQIWLSWNRDLILEILEEARSSYEQSRSRRVEHFRPDTYGEWTSSMIPARSMTSLFHDPDLLQDLLEDVRLFLNSKQMYEDLGIPYRRGYLLAGPPGTGKSSLILALASHFELPIYTMPLRGVEVSGERLANMLANCRKPSMVALEDVDCMKVATSRKSEANDRMTIGDLLNVVDGIGASEDRLLFLTANQPETLDYALTRAGRVDRKFYIDYARDEELRSFHTRISGYMPVESWPEFRASLPERTTIADAQAVALQGKSWNRDFQRKSPAKPQSNVPASGL